MKISKTAILPIVSVICLAVATITGHQVSASIQDEIATIATTVIGAGISIWGVIKNHSKKGDVK
jgi:hypothetical protein